MIASLLLSFGNGFLIPSWVSVCNWECQAQREHMEDFSSANVSVSFFTGLSSCLLPLPSVPCLPLIFYVWYPQFEKSRWIVEREFSVTFFQWVSSQRVEAWLYSPGSRVCTWVCVHILCEHACARMFRVCTCRSVWARVHTHVPHEHMHVLCEHARSMWTCVRVHVLCEHVCTCMFCVSMFVLAMSCGLGLEKPVLCGGAQHDCRHIRGHSGSVIKLAFPSFFLAEEVDVEF